MVIDESTAYAHMKRWIAIAERRIRNTPAQHNKSRKGWMNNMKRDVINSSVVVNEWRVDKYRYSFLVISEDDELTGFGVEVITLDSKIFDFNVVPTGVVISTHALARIMQCAKSIHMSDLKPYLSEVFEIVGTLREYLEHQPVEFKTHEIYAEGFGMLPVEITAAGECLVKTVIHKEVLNYSKLKKVEGLSKGEIMIL